MSKSALLHFIISTPCDRPFDAEAEYILLGTPEGDIGVRPRHEDAVLVVKPGPVMIHTGGREQPYTTAGGVFYLEKNRATLLTSFAAPTAEYEKKRAQYRDQMHQRYSEEIKSEADLHRMKMAMQRSLTQKT